ncbi:MAG: hypothetical protein WD273_02050 [Trueperaceae bacterium]
MSYVNSKIQQAGVAGAPVRRLIIPPSGVEAGAGLAPAPNVMI